MENISVTLQDQNSLNSLEQIKSNLERQIDSEKTKFEAIKNEIRRLSNFLTIGTQILKKKVKTYLNREF